MEVFPHTMMVINHCLASNAPLQPDRERRSKVLSQYRIDGQPVIQETASLDGVLDLLNHEGEPKKWMNREHMEVLCRDATILTDDNLGHEYKA